MDFENSDLLSVLKNLEEQIKDQSFAIEDDSVKDFVLTLCQSIDSRNVLTPEETAEYSALVENAEVFHGEEFETAFREFFPDGLQDHEDEDPSYITEEIELVISNIEEVEAATKILSDKIQHVSTGIRQLEQKEKAAHINMIREKQHCIDLDKKIYAVKKEVLKSLHCHTNQISVYQKEELSPQFIGQISSEPYKNRCIEWDYYVKVLMKRYLESYTSLTMEHEADKLKLLEKRLGNVEYENICMLSFNEGRRAGIKTLRELMIDIQESKFDFSLEDIRNNTVILEVKLNESKQENNIILGNHVKPYILQNVYTSHIQHLKEENNAYLLMKLQFIFEKFSTLLKCLKTGLTNIEILQTLMFIERQQLCDMNELIQSCCIDIRDEYSQCAQRMNTMQELKESYNVAATEENPLIRCIARILSDEDSSCVSVDFNCLMQRVKQLNQDIQNEEDVVLNGLFNKFKLFFLKNENAIKSAEKHCAWLTEPKQMQSEITAQSNNVDQLLQEFEGMLQQVKHNFEEKKEYFDRNVFLKERRLLWVYFLSSPERLSSIVSDLENQVEKNKKEHVKKIKQEPNFFLMY